MDTEFEVLNNSVISLVPYVDLNRIAGAGNGAPGDNAVVLPRSRLPSIATITSVGSSCPAAGKPGSIDMLSTSLMGTSSR